MVKEKEEQKKKKKPWVTPTITAVVYDPKEKVTASVSCETSGSGAPDQGVCEALGPCQCI